MSFDSLVNVRMPEEEIFDRMVEILQRNFSVYQEVHVCLPLNPAEGLICSVKEVRLYNIHNEKDIAAKREFIFSGECFQVYAFAKFMNGFYWASIGGHFFSKEGDVYPTFIKNIHAFTDDEDRALRKLPSKELLLGAFGEITEELQKKKLAKYSLRTPCEAHGFYSELSPRLSVTISQI